MTARAPKIQPPCRHIMARFSRENRRQYGRGNFEKFIIARDILPTLYELLGARPEDDADSLRAAFRKAAKASHPDNNPDDPDAPQRFRQIVRAHAILRDEGRRAAYDQLLTEAQQPTPDTRRKVFAEAGLPGPISSMVIASVSIGAFAVLERVLTDPVVAAQVQELSVRAMALTAAMPTPASRTVGKASEKTSERDKPDKILSAKEPEIPGTVAEVAPPAVAATADVAATTSNDTAAAAMSEPVISEPVISEPVVKDARYYLERGNLAYRSGDLPLALTDFDLAINLDPNSSDAYVNRAIVFRKMGDLKRALADVNQARRIDEGAISGGVAVTPLAAGLGPVPGESAR
jgi:tetratricopeptide (TPR) repeat protein